MRTSPCPQQSTVRKVRGLRACSLPPLAHLPRHSHAVPSWTATRHRPAVRGNSPSDCTSCTSNASLRPTPPPSAGPCHCNEVPNDPVKASPDSVLDLQQFEEAEEGLKAQGPPAQHVLGAVQRVVHRGAAAGLSSCGQPGPSRLGRSRRCGSL